MSNPKLSVFTVMVPDLSPGEAAQTFSELGYTGVEWRVTHVPPERRSEPPSFWGNNLCTFEPTLAAAEHAKNAAEAAGLTIVSLGTYIEVGDLAATENALQFAQVCGSGAIRVGVGRWPNADSYPVCFERARDFLGKVVERARHYHVKALIETHHNTIIPSASLAFRVVDGFDPDYIGVIHDAGNMAREGYEAYLMAFQLLGPYLAHVHVKNARYTRPAAGGVWQGEWSPLDDGIINWEALFAALQDVGYDGWLGLEDFSGTRSSRETLVFDRGFLQPYVTELYGKE